jgi:hypothetical protein
MNYRPEHSWRDSVVGLSQSEILVTVVENKVSKQQMERGTSIPTQWRAAIRMEIQPTLSDHNSEDIIQLRLYWHSI